MKGGAGKGQGRKKGSTTKKLRNLNDYFTDKEIKKIAADLKEQLDKTEGDTRLKLFVLEHIFGKPPQRLEMTGKDGESLGVVILPIREKNETHN